MIRPMIKLFRFALQHPLCREHRLSTVARIVRWQLASRILPAEAVVPFTATTRLLMRRGMAGATGNFYCGLHEFADMAFVLHFLRAADIFVDVGANVGTYTVLASGHVGARSISFEPVPVTFDALVDNIRINNLDDLVSAQNMGVAAEAGEIVFTSSQDTVNHAVSEGDMSLATVNVPVAPLDELLTSSPACIKIDVEGFEANVIAGAQKTLGQAGVRAVVLELNGSGSRYGFDDMEIHAAMLEHGFLPFAYAPLQRRLTELQQPNCKGNTLYLRDCEFVEERIAAAPRVDLAWRSF